MRIGIQGWGSEGDLRPLVALATGLRRAGHAVRLVITAVDGADYGPLCREVEVPLRVVPERMAFSLPSVASGADSVDPLKLSREMNEQAFYPYLDELYEAALALCARSDVVVWGYASWYVKAAALKAGIPSVAVHYLPGLAPSRVVPPAGFPDWGWFNRVFWSVGRTMLDLGFRARPARFFSAKGLPPPRHVLPDLLFSDRLNLLAASPSFCPPAPDWGPRYQVCGQLVFPDEGKAWTPSTGLREFLGEGPKPVLMSLGSMEHLAPRRARELLIGAARAAGERAILQTKRESGEGADGDLYFLPWAPHAGLLPHCAAIVHHGGAGTSHAALRAGLPSVVLPFIFEQRVWADRLRRVGTAGKPLSFWKATAPRLSARIAEALASERMRARAKALAAAMAREDGVGTAVRLLEQLGAGSGGAAAEGQVQQ